MDNDGVSMVIGVGELEGTRYSSYLWYLYWRFNFNHIKKIEGTKSFSQRIKEDNSC